MNEIFRKLAHKASEAAGRAWAFVLAASVILVWALTGPLFGFSNTWQLVINTGTTVLTFLMVFLIQNAQNREAKAIHLKLDELIWSIRGARNAMVNIEDLSDEELVRLRQEFQRSSMQSGVEAQTAGEGDGSVVAAIDPVRMLGAFKEDPVAHEVAVDAKTRLQRAITSLK